MPKWTTENGVVTQFHNINQAKVTTKNRPFGTSNVQADNNENNLTQWGRKA
jgi:hypothetical protein